MIRRIVVCLLSSILLLTISLAEAEQQGSSARIGYLDDGTAFGNVELLDAFRHQMSQLGWVEGKNLTIEYRFGEGKGLNRLAELSGDLVRLKLDVIVVSATSSALAAKKTTDTIPIVMSSVGDPVRQGLVDSLARPGRNITGVAGLTPELGGKRLEILKDVMPKSTLVGVLRGDRKGRGGQTQVEEMRAAASVIGLRLEELGVASDPKSLENAFLNAVRERVDAIITTSGPIIFGARKQIVMLAGKHRLPGIYPQKEFAEEGGLMFYGTDRRDIYRRSAFYVDKILKGAKPADLPVEQPTKFEFVINLKTAKQIGLMIPPTVLARADKVIK
jgi:putative tryptophan/tyrosine transport system substrate-binding protein